VIFDWTIFDYINSIVNYLFASAPQKMSQPQKHPAKT